jgi:hypothetical protein
VLATSCGDDPSADSAEDTAPQCNGWSAKHSYIYAVTDWGERCNPDRAEHRASYLLINQVIVSCYPVDACLLEECIRAVEADTVCDELPTICEEAIDYENQFESCGG